MCVFGVWREKGIKSSFERGGSRSVVVGFLFGGKDLAGNGRMLTWHVVDPLEPFN